MPDCCFHGAIIAIPHFDVNRPRGEALDATSRRVYKSAHVAYGVHSVL